MDLVRPEAALDLPPGASLSSGASCASCASGASSASSVSNKQTQNTWSKVVTHEMVRYLSHKLYRGNLYASHIVLYCNILPTRLKIDV